MDRKVLVYRIPYWAPGVTRPEDWVAFRLPKGDMGYAQIGHSPEWQDGGPVDAPKV